MSVDDRVKVLRTEMQTLTNQAKALYSDLETKGDKATADERITLNAMIDDGTAKRQELKRLEALAETEEYISAPIGYGRKSAQITPPQHKSWGCIVVESEEFKRADRGSTASTPRMDRVNVKAIYGSSESVGGALVQTQRLPEIVDIPQRPRSILDYINQSTTNSDAVEYAVLGTRTNNAAFTAEYTGGNFGLKPESNLAWTLATVNVKTIATWVPVSRRILSDAPRLSGIIDGELTEMVRVALENQIFSGDGVGENFTGITATSGILTRTMQAGSRALAGDTVADTIRRAVTDVALQFYTPNAVMLNPTDGEEIDLQKDDNKQYVMYRDAVSGRVWSLARVETAALTANTALVGDFEMAATIWDRQQLDIRVGEPNDMFLRNAVAVLAEGRYAFAVTRPTAICKVTLV